MTSTVRWVPCGQAIREEVARGAGTQRVVPPHRPTVRGH